MLAQNPLDIPEVTSHVASYLYRTDLASCVRVSKSWRDIFLPHLWRDVTRSFLNDQITGSRHFGPSQEALNKHRHLVRYLSLDGYVCEDDVCPLPNLRHLKIYYLNTDMAVTRVRETFNWDITEISPLLDRLLICNLDMDRQSCQRLLEHPHLRNLELSKTGIMPDARQDIWEACKNLESLSLKRVRFRGNSPSIPADTVFNRLRTLVIKEIDFGCLQRLPVILHCPILESFELETRSFKVRMMIKHPIQMDRWSQVASLIIPIFPTDEEWALILERIGNCFENVTCLHVVRGEFGSRSLEALGPYFSNLVDLRLTSCNSSTITGVLCSCRKLEILHVPDIFADDIAQGGPWVCQQLLELKIGIRVKETDQGLQPLVFKRLSTLVRLTKLDMSGANHDNGEGVLEFRLDCGLGELAGLQALRTVVYYDAFAVRLRDQIEAKDVEWMIDNWKKLKRIRGVLNINPVVEAQLTDLLKNYGI
ncbi:hypothetical protein BGX34_005695, partial [Mortierella sp. NVP85]